MPQFAELAKALAEAARALHARGWLLGTSGNLSAVLGGEPFRLAVTGSGLDKGSLTADQILQVDAAGTVVEGRGRPSDETGLHLALVRARGAKAVVHTHSVWATLASEEGAGAGGVALEGYEMLKGLRGVATHEHREWVPILPNSQDYGWLAGEIARALDRHPAAHGILLRRHGLYTWGESLAEARRHTEILEFLLEVSGREREGRGHGAG